MDYFETSAIAALTPESSLQDSEELHLKIEEPEAESSDADIKIFELLS